MSIPLYMIVKHALKNGYISLESRELTEAESPRWPAVFKIIGTLGLYSLYALIVIASFKTVPAKGSEGFNLYLKVLWVVAFTVGISGVMGTGFAMARELAVSKTLKVMMVCGVAMMLVQEILYVFSRQ